MSADNIATCPACNEPRLREYYDIGLVAQNAAGLLYVPTHVVRATYRAHCYECGWEWVMNPMEATVPLYPQPAASTD